MDRCSVASVMLLLENTDEWTRMWLWSTSRASSGRATRRGMCDSAKVWYVNFARPVIDIGTASSTVQFKSLKKRLHRTSGTVLENDPELLIQVGQAE